MRKLLGALAILATTQVQASTCSVDQVINQNMDETYVLFTCADGTSRKDVVGPGVQEGDVFTNGKLDVKARYQVEQAVRAAQAAARKLGTVKF